MPPPPQQQPSLRAEYDKSHDSKGHHIYIKVVVDNYKSDLRQCLVNHWSKDSYVSLVLRLVYAFAMDEGTSSPGKVCVLYFKSDNKRC